MAGCADDVRRALAEAVIIPEQMLTFIANQAVAAPGNDRWKPHHALLHRLIALPENDDAPTEAQVSVVLTQIQQQGEAELVNLGAQLKGYPDYLGHFRSFSRHLLEEYMPSDNAALPRAVFRTVIVQALLPILGSNLEGPFSTGKFLSDMKSMITFFYEWFYVEKKITDKGKNEAGRCLLLRGFVLAAQAVVTLHCYVEGVLGFFPRYLVRAMCGFASSYHKLRLPFHSIHAECLASIGNLLTLCSTPAQRQDIVRRLTLHKLFRGANQTYDLGRTFSFEGGRKTLVHTLVASAVKMSPSTVSAILSLQAMHCWFDQFPELLGEVWLPMQTKVNSGVRGSGRRKAAPPTHSEFLTYKVFQHQIAVDRAILRYWFKCSKGSLGRLNHDAISDVERYIYGPHSWPRWFFRDRYTPTAQRHST